MAKAQRNSNIELLRVIAMLMIVAHHYAAFGFYAEDLALSRNKLFVDLFGMNGHIGVNLFVLSTGCYSVSSRFRLKKILTLMGSLWFYCLGILAIFALTGVLPIGREELKGALFPLLTGQYWFASYYVLLLLLSPFLNALIGALDQKSHAALCLLLFTLCTVLPVFSLSFLDGMLPLFAALYLVGAWLRLYLPAGSARTRRRTLALLLGLYALCILRVAVADTLGKQSGDLARLTQSIYFMNVFSPYSFLIALLLFMAGCQREAAYRPFLNRVGGLCFGVYLFHANPLLSAVVWQRAFHTAAFVESRLLPLHALGTVAALFLAGCLIELLRQKSFGKLWDRAVDWFTPLLERLLARTGALLLRMAEKLVGSEGV